MAETSKLILSCVFTLVAGGIFYRIFSYIVLRYFKELDQLKKDHNKLRSEFENLKGQHEVNHGHKK